MIALRSEDIFDGRLSAVNYLLIESHVFKSLAEGREESIVRRESNHDSGIQLGLGAGKEAGG